MKKIFLFLILGLFFLNFISSLDCQYKENETYRELELGLYDSNGNFVGSPLEFKDFSGGAMNIQGCNPPSFKIYNSLGEEITLNVTYTTSWNTAFGPRSGNHQATISIQQYSNSEILYGSCPDLGSGSISQNSIKYLITSPELITLENEQVTKQRENCQKCGNGVCLNDGADCNPIYDNSKCGSGICNIAGFCGAKGTLKVVDCPNGLRNCNDKICLPASKEVGEIYLCNWECKSDRWDENKCLISKEELTKRWIYWTIFILFIISVGFIILNLCKNNPKYKIKKLLYKYKKEYEHASSEVFYDSNRKYFRIKYKDGNIYDLHWKIYRDKVEKNLNGKEVHHVDYDELDNDLRNLIALKKEDHQKFKHYLIKSKGNWESGIHQIKEQLGWKDSDFPEHIQQEIKRRQEQKKLLTVILFIGF